MTPQKRSSGELILAKQMSLVKFPAFEEEFKIEIPDKDAEKITRVKEAVEYIEAHAKDKK